MQQLLSDYKRQEYFKRFFFYSYKSDQSMAYQHREKIIVSVILPYYLWGRGWYVFPTILAYQLPCLSVLSTPPPCVQDIRWRSTTSEVSRQPSKVPRSYTYGHVAPVTWNQEKKKLDSIEWVKRLKKTKVTNFAQWFL